MLNLAFNRCLPAKLTKVGNSQQDFKELDQKLNELKGA